MAYHFDKVLTTASFAREQDNLIEWLFVRGRVNDVNFAYKLVSQFFNIQNSSCCLKPDKLLNCLMILWHIFASEHA